MTFQFYALYPNLPVEDNLAYPLFAENLSKAEIAKRVERVSEVLDLKSILKRRPHQLSEGEKQRVAVGRSIVRDPTCFLFDEPLSRLDIQLRQTMRTQIKEILTKLDKPTVIVTHDQIEALTMADRIAVMQRGKVEQVATPHDLFSKPDNLFVAGFIGTPQMNLMQAVLIEAREPDSDGFVRARFSVLGENISARVNKGVATLGAGAKVTLGIRPRSFEFANGAGRQTPSMPRVDLIEPMGAEMLVHLVEQGADMRCVVPSAMRCFRWRSCLRALQDRPAPCLRQRRETRGVAPCSDPSAGCPSDRRRRSNNRSSQSASYRSYCCSSPSRFRSIRLARASSFWPVLPSTLCRCARLADRSHRSSRRADHRDHLLCRNPDRAGLGAALRRLSDGGLSVGADKRRRDFWNAPNPYSVRFNPVTFPTGVAR